MVSLALTSPSFLLTDGDGALLRSSLACAPAWPGAGTAWSLQSGTESWLTPRVVSQKQARPEHRQGTVMKLYLLGKKEDKDVKEGGGEFILNSTHFSVICMFSL